MGKRGALVPRPVTSGEYEIVFGATDASRGWNDLRATAKNALRDAYDYLTEHPTAYDPDRCYRLRGDLGTATVSGKQLEQWQYKVTDGGRLWYAVQPPDPKAKAAGVVHIMRAVTGHPNETDSPKNFR
ncbi:hypothetical protein [Plantibacter sp.]|uniref:hypothetical protein n=1 Tax=Plantibacter sp. TaxID=1871045 RepID=UPI003261BCC3